MWGRRLRVLFSVPFHTFCLILANGTICSELSPATQKDWLLSNKERAWLRFLWGAYPKIQVNQKYWSSMRDLVQRKADSHMRKVLWAMLVSNTVKDWVHLVWSEDPRDATNPTDSSIFPFFPDAGLFLSMTEGVSHKDSSEESFQLREKNRCKGPEVIAS